jgi:hypothetical protein
VLICARTGGDIEIKPAAVTASSTLWHPAEMCDVEMNRVFMILSHQGCLASDRWYIAGLALDVSFCISPPKIRQ